jgi:predicted metal-dependent phosphoesterase TrpH
VLKFARNKLVGIEVKDKETLLVHGILDDDIYSIRMDLSIDVHHLEIITIAGEWTRFTTSECKRAIPFIQEAVGFRITEGFTQKVRKVIGKKACRHFANLLIECCHTAKDAAELLKDEMQQDNVPVITKEIQQEDNMYANKHDNFGIVIDLHTHSAPASPCSFIPVNQLIKEAQQIGLDGICLTDHNYIWDRNTVEELRQKHGFLILRGNEITTDQGDMLVFGMDRDVQGIIRIEDLKKETLKSGGVIIAAHPFRGFLAFGVEQLGLTPEKAMQRSLFKYVDAVEILNSKVTEIENRLTRKVAAGLGLPGTGGSDAHDVGEVGIYATRFTDNISNEADLVKAIKDGKCAPVVFRDRSGL